VGKASGHRIADRGIADLIMPQGVEVIETGRLTVDGVRTVLVRDDGGCWGVFFDCKAREFIGRRVTVRGTRFGFASLHVTGIAHGTNVPPERRDTETLLLLPDVALQLVVVVTLLWPVVWAARRLAGLLF
jgi:Protein of unknown function (DUF5818)